MNRGVTDAAPKNDRHRHFAAIVVAVTMIVPRVMHARTIDAVTVITD